MRITKSWETKANKFAEYYRDEYNKDRDILATLGSAGYTFTEDIEMLVLALMYIAESELGEKIEKEVLKK